MWAVGECDGCGCAGHTHGRPAGAVGREARRCRGVLGFARWRICWRTVAHGPERCFGDGVGQLAPTRGPQLSLLTLNMFRTLSTASCSPFDVNSVGHAKRGRRGAHQVGRGSAQPPELIRVARGTGGQQGTTQATQATRTALGLATQATPATQAPRAAWATLATWPTLATALHRSNGLCRRLPRRPHGLHGPHGPHDCMGHMTHGPLPHGPHGTWATRATQLDIGLPKFLYRDTAASTAMELGLGSEIVVTPSRSCIHHATHEGLGGPSVYALLARVAYPQSNTRDPSRPKFALSLPVPAYMSCWHTRRIHSATHETFEGLAFALSLLALGPKALAACDRLRFSRRLCSCWLHPVPVSPPRPCSP